jgi:hypothetical protein
MGQLARIRRFGPYFLFFGLEKQRYATDHLIERIAVAVDLPDMFSFF